jgi:hypothetical protein
MTLHTDIPTRSELEQLLAARDPLCVSIYLSTSPLPQEAQAGRSDLKTAALREEFGVVDEVARRVLLNGGRVLAVRHDDLPERTPLAAIMRHVL